MNIIGLGKAGCAIADKFAQYPQYDIYKIDVGLKGYKKNGIYDMPAQKSPEQYEAKCRSMRTFFKNVSGDVLFVVAGSGNISACSLRVLEALQNCRVDILYIQPDTTILTGAANMLERMAFGVFQEYTRSAVFNKLYIVNNTVVGDIIGDIPIVHYYDKINELIVHTMHMINVYNHSNPIHEHKTACDDFSNIGTFGLCNIDKQEERLFFPLKLIKEKYYIYALNEDTLENDGSLFKKITSQAKEKVKKEKLAVNYSIHSTEYENNFAYIIANTSFIQTDELTQQQEMP